MNILKRRNFRLDSIVFIGVNLLFINICGAANAPPNPPDMIVEPPLKISNPPDPVIPLDSVIDTISVGAEGTKHGATVTITSSGGGFGSKGTSTGEPILWDDCSGSDYLDLWSGGWPTAAGQPSSTPRYAASGSIGGVTVPHSNVTHSLAARAYDEGGGGGYPGNNMIWHRLPDDGNLPGYIYISWYQRVHPGYNSGDNFKWFDYSGGSSPYDSRGNWYLEYVGGVGGQNHINDNGAGLVNQVCNGYHFSDYLCNRWYLGGSTNPNSQWVKLEVVIRVSASDTEGWIDLYEDGVLQLDAEKGGGTGQHSYNGATDQTITGSARNFGIGGYNRNKGINNWRFFNDLYIDYTLAHVIIGNNPVYSESTVKEVQIPQNWSNESISFTVNQGAFSAGDRAYLFVINSDGVPSSGYPITIGVQ